MNRLLMGSIMAAGALLSGCSSETDTELRAWVQEQRGLTKSKVAAIPAPKTFAPQTYTQVGAVDPFSIQKMNAGLKKGGNAAAVNTALITPELNRRRESLEAFPLDGFTMVGSVIKEGKPLALVKVEELLYQVRVGNYLGQNYGKITKITESEVVLREVVQDAAGEWVERAASLQLQERSK
jgi:type IV pilus assembly protein PilP